MNRAFGVLVVVAIAAMACGDSDGDLGATGVPTAVPTAVPTVTGAPEAVCEAQERVLELAGQLQAGSVETQEDVTAELGELQGRLESEADQLESSGQQEAADQVRSAAGALEDLQDAVASQDPTQLASAVANLADAAEQIALCEESG
jgi:hypothetical protein